MNAPLINLRLFFVPGLSLLILLAPFWRGLYFQTELLLALMFTAVLFLACLGEQFASGAEDFFQDPLDFAVLAMLFAYSLSLFSAVDIHAALLELLKFSGFFMVYWMAAQAAREERDFDRLLLAAYLAALGMAVIGLGAALGWIHLDGAWEEGHIRSTLQYHNALAIYLAALNVIGMALSLKTRGIIARLAYAGGNYLLVLVILGSLSRGTWLLYPVGLAGFILLIPAQYRRQAVYQIILFLGAGLTAGRFFFNSIKSEETLWAGFFLIVGLLMVLAVEALTRGDSSPGNQLDADDHKSGSNLEAPARPVLENWQNGLRRLCKSSLVIRITALMLLQLVFNGIAPNPVQGLIHYIVPETAIARADKLSPQDNSVQERGDTYHIAGQIIQDHPFTGVGGGGWEALYHSYADRLYWSNEVHNYYLKTWIEAGLLGILALLALGSLLLFKLIKTYPRTRKGTDGLSLWAAATAVVLLALHGLIDFELSMAAVGFLFYGLIGAIRAERLRWSLPMRKLYLGQRKSVYSLPGRSDPGNSC